MIYYCGNDTLEKDETGTKRINIATGDEVQNGFKLKGTPISLIATNITSFMGGKYNPWADAFDRDV